MLLNKKLENITNEFLIKNNFFYLNKKYDTFLFELSWEVCNKCGGIYTVITSKNRFAQKYFKNYFLIGPYIETTSEFLEEEIPENLRSSYLKLKELGIILHYGKFDIENKPIVLLVDFEKYSIHINDIKGKIWELYKVDSMNTNWYDWDKPILWSWVSGLVIETIKNELNLNKVLVHAHEWLSGGAIFYLKSLDNKDDFKCVFTTHATMLGRALSGHNFNLYDLENQIDPDKKAYEIGVHTKHQTEKALANISDAFTTVSHITDNEAKFFYKKEADFLLFNGFDNSKLLDFEKVLLDYLKERNFINEFIKGFFYKSYPVDVNKLEIFFTSGRNEFHNKGIDLIIDSLSLLNKKLIETNSEKEILVFFLVMIGDFEKDENILNSLNEYNNFRKIEKDFKKSLYQHLEVQKEKAPLSTHKIYNNEIINKLLENGLDNNVKNKVKVILIPEILNGSEKVFNLSYYNFIKGMDLGIFPSYYEPWGYTPEETLAYGIPSVTSDLSGFGRYINKNFSHWNSVKVIKRLKKNYDESKNELYNYLLDFLNEENEFFFVQKYNAKKLALFFDWNNFYFNYLKTYNYVLNKNNK